MDSRTCSSAFVNDNLHLSRLWVCKEGIISKQTSIFLIETGASGVIYSSGLHMCSRLSEHHFLKNTPSRMNKLCSVSLGVYLVLCRRSKITANEQPNNFKEEGRMNSLYMFKVCIFFLTSATGLGAQLGKIKKGIMFLALNSWHKLWMELGQWCFLRVGKYSCISSLDTARENKPANIMS